jgi:ankyrin repeat protein
MPAERGKRRRTLALLFALLSISPAALGQGASFEGMTHHPLITAIDKGKLAEVQALLRRPGLNPDAFDAARDRLAPIHAAATKGNTDIAAALLAAGADVNILDALVQRWTPLFYAIDWGLVPMVRLLIERGANVNARTSHGYSPLRMAASADQHALAMVRLLIERGADANATADNKTTVLQSAVQGDNAEVVKLLLTSGADTEATTPFDSTVITAAVLKGNEDILAALLARRPVLTHRDTLFGFAPLHHAASNGRLDIVKMLLRAGGDPAQLSKNGKFADDIAVEQARDPALAAFLKAARAR